MQIQMAFWLRFYTFYAQIAKKIFKVYFFFWFLKTFSFMFKLKMQFLICFNKLCVELGITDIVQVLHFAGQFNESELSNDFNPLSIFHRPRTVCEIHIAVKKYSINSPLKGLKRKKASKEIE